MEQPRTIKVAMVCTMSNPMVRAHLPLDDGKLYNRIRKVFGMAPKYEGFHDTAPWNTRMAEELGQREDVDLTIIAVHANMKKMKVSFTENNVKYIFLNFQWANLIKRVINNKDRWSRINPFAKIARREINRVKPDLVLLVGLENNYYSCVALGIKKYPVYALCQTIYNNPVRSKYATINSDNAYTEMRLFNELKYIGVFCKMHYELASKLSPQSYIFKYGFPCKSELLAPTETTKEYDFVNFAMSMSYGKGYHDSIRALSIVKKKYPLVKLNLIGMCSDDVRKELTDLIIQNGLDDNVVFTPFFEKQSDLFLHVQKSRFAVLPCKVDNISGTMMQAMQLGLPIVVYRTTGTPSFNKEKQCALIAEKENVEELAQNMLALMDNPELAESLRINGREWQEKRYEAGLHNGDHIIENFKAIIGHFRNGTPIPPEQLFNPDIDD